MARFVLRTEGEAWATLVAELDRMRALAAGSEVDMAELGKALASVVGATRDVFARGNMASVRMEAAAKALDLRTGKTELEQFARR